MIEEFKFAGRPWISFPSDNEDEEMTDDQEGLI
jgi:hypothetical protein